MGQSEENTHNGDCKLIQTLLNVSVERFPVENFMYQEINSIFFPFYSNVITVSPLSSSSSLPSSSLPSSSLSSSSSLLSSSLLSSLPSLPSSSLLSSSSLLPSSSSILLQWDNEEKINVFKWFCNLALKTLGDEFYKKKLFFQSKHNPCSEAAQNFNIKMNKEIESMISLQSTSLETKVFLKFMELEKLWKFLMEELWWRKYAILDYESFIRVPPMKDSNILQQKNETRDIQSGNQQQQQEHQHQKEQHQKEQQQQEHQEQHQKEENKNRMKSQTENESIFNVTKSTNITTDSMLDTKLKQRIPYLNEDIQKKIIEGRKKKKLKKKGKDESPSTPTRISYYDVTYRSSISAFVMSKQCHETIRYLIWGYHYCYQSDSATTPISSSVEWWYKCVQMMFDKQGRENVENVVLIDLDNVGSSIPLLVTRNFDYPKTIFIAICGPNYKVTPILTSILHEQRDKLLLIRIHFDGSDSTKMNAFENYLFGFYQSGYFKKYKDAADHGISAFCGAIHRDLPLKTMIWVISRDDGLEHPVRHLRMRGRYAKRTTMKDMMHDFDENLLSSTHWETIFDNSCKNAQERLNDFNFSNIRFEKYQKKEDTNYNKEQYQIHTPLVYTDDEISRLHLSSFGIDYRRQILEDDFASTVLSDYLEGDSKKCLTSLKLRGRRLFHSGFSKIVSFFESGTHNLTDVDLRGNRIGDISVKVLCNALCKVGKHLKSLDISSCAFGDTGAMSVAKLLSESDSLQILDCRSNKIGVIGGTEIANALKKNCSLISLLLRDNAMGAYGCNKLFNVLKHYNSTLATLDLRGNIKKDVAILFDDLFDQNYNQEELPLSHIDHSNKHRVETKKSSLGYLASLDLAGCSIGEIACEKLAQYLLHSNNQELFRLSLDYDHINGGIVCISKLLIENTCLVALTLGRNKIDDLGAINLSAALEKNITLTWLDLQKNEIGSIGATALSRILKHNQTLAHLNLKGNQIGNIGAIEIGKMLEVNKSLTYLDIATNEIKELGGTSIAMSLRKNDALQELMLSNNRIGDACAKLLGEVMNSKNTALQRVTLENINLRHEGIVSISNDVDSTNRVQNLALATNSIGDQGMEFVAIQISPFLPNLHKEYISCKVLSTMFSRLHSLDLSNNHLGDEGIKTLCSSNNYSLANSMTLSYLHLGANAITAQGAIYLGELLSLNSSITSLNLADNNIYDDGIQTICKGLLKNETLTFLRVAENRITSKGVESIRDCVLKKPSGSNVLAYLHLQNNQIGDDGARYLAEGIKFPDCAIQYLNVERNSVSADSAHCLFKAGQRIASDHESGTIICVQISI